MKTTTRNILLGIVGVFLIVLVTSPKISLFKSNSSAEQSTSGDPRLPVSIVVIQPSVASDRIQSTGTLLANEGVDLTSEVSGKIEQISFTEGSRVRKGDLLLKINDDELQALSKKLDSQKKVAEEKLRRREVLIQRQSISPEDFEVASNELNAVLADIDVNGARIAKTEIRAPFDGYIGLRFVSPGTYVTPNMKIASIQNIDRIKIDFSIPEKYVASVKKGDKVRFSITSDDNTYEGTVYAIEPKIDPVTRTVQLRAIADNRERKIMPGAFARVSLLLDEREDALMVPTEAIIPELQGQKVLLMKNGMVAEQKVTIGMRTDRVVQVVEGVSAGDTVLTSGLLQARPGMPVRVAPDQTSTKELQ